MNKNAFIDYDNSLYIVGQLEPSCTSVIIMLHMKISLSIGTFKFAIITEIPHRLLYDKFLRKTNVLHHDYSSINFVLLITYFSMWNSKVWKKICLRVCIQPRERCPAMYSDRRQYKYCTLQRCFSFPQCKYFLIQIID